MIKSCYYKAVLCNNLHFSVSLTPQAKKKNKNYQTAGGFKKATSALHQKSLISKSLSHILEKLTTKNST